MDRYLFNRHVVHPSIGVNMDFGESDCIPFDQTGVRPFNIDPDTGNPISDISCILRAKGLDQSRLISDFEQYESEFLPEDISDEDALKFYQPRLVQMPSELAELAERIAKERIEDEAREKGRKDEQDEADKT